MRRVVWTFIPGLLALAAFMLLGGFVLGLRGESPARAATNARPSGQFTPTPTPTVGCGLAWNVVPSADPSADGNQGLYSVAVVSANDVWAVGYYTSTGTLEQKLTEHWNGTQWTIVPDPGDGALYS